jgi:hypothetical protein
MKSYEKIPSIVNPDEIIDYIRRKEAKRKRRVRTKAIWVSSFSVTIAVILLAFYIQNTRSFFFTSGSNSYSTAVNNSDMESESVTTSKPKIQYARYTINVNPNLYKRITDSKSERIELINPLNDTYPEVAMEITQFPNISIDEMVTKLLSNLRQKNKQILPSREISSPVKGKEIVAIGGTGGKEWDDPVTKITVFHNRLDGVFVITGKYFLEAEEGHGARFSQMISTFKVIDIN